MERIPILTDSSQCRSLLNKLSRYKGFLPSMAKRLRPITNLLKQLILCCFTSGMECTIRGITCKFREPFISTYSRWDAAVNGSRHCRVYCDACRNGSGATLEDQKPDDTRHPTTFLRQIALSNLDHSTVLEREAGSKV